MSEPHTSAGPRAAPAQPAADIDTAALRAWLLEHLPPALSAEVAAHPLQVVPFDSGHSNLTYAAQAGPLELVVRRAPPGVKAKTAHDMVREARVLSAIRPNFPLAPEVFAVCDDPAVIGTCFFVMERLHGPIPGRSLPVRLTPGQAKRLMAGLMDLHADLHAIDLEATGLADLGKPDGYVARQVAGWSKRYRAARTDDVPTCEALMAWLDRHQPTESGAALIHNDFKLDNVVLDAADPTRIVGVIDWEMATVGDPLLDLGASMAYWVQRDDPPELQVIRTLPSTVPGMPTRAELVARYLERSGRQVEDFTWYYVYGLFRLAVIAQQIYLRYVLGQSKNPRFAGLGVAVRALSDHAWRVIRARERDQRAEARRADLLSDRSLRLDGKVAVVTGATRGIGEAVARLFAAQGAHVVVSSRKQASCEAVAASIRDAGGQATALACHVGDAEARAAFVATVVKQLGRVDILVNNAATNPYFGHILDTPTEAVAKTVDVNLSGAFHLCQLAGQVMRDQGGGVILNTASVNGVVPAAGQGIYSITKAALVSLSRAFAKECASLGIRVNTVLPGLTRTKFASALTDNPAMLSRILPLIPEGRVADPEEIAPAFLYLASDAAAYVTGAGVTVDGGLLA